MWCRRVSRVLSARAVPASLPGFDGGSGEGGRACPRRAAISLGASLPARSSGLPASCRSDRSSSFRSRKLRDLARGGVCRAPLVAERAVRSYRTVSPLPDPVLCARRKARAIGGLISVALSLTRDPVRAGGCCPPPCPVVLGLSSAAPRTFRSGCVSGRRQHRTMIGVQQPFPESRVPPPESRSAFPVHSSCAGVSISHRGVAG